jgi:hypothetical protein
MYTVTPFLFGRTMLAQCFDPAMSSAPLQVNTLHVKILDTPSSATFNRSSFLTGLLPASPDLLSESFTLLLVLSRTPLRLPRQKEHQWG